jgi:hypothetical protein
MSPVALESWLESYGRAWQARDANAFAELFTADAAYYWGPFREPQRGRKAIASAVGSAFSGQRDVNFKSRRLGNSAAPYVAHWMCEFVRSSSRRRVTVDGIFVLRFDEHGLCEEFREWWHCNEPESASAAAAPSQSIERTRDK